MTWKYGDSPFFTAYNEYFVEQRLVELDDKFPSLITDERRRSTLSVGSLLNYIQYSELTLPDDDLLNLAKRRFLNREATGGVRTR